MVLVETMETLGILLRTIFLNNSTKSSPISSNVIISPSSPTTTDSLTVSIILRFRWRFGPGTTIQWSRDSSIITSLDDSSSVPSSFISKDETECYSYPSDGIDFGSPGLSGTNYRSEYSTSSKWSHYFTNRPTDDSTMSYSFQILIWILNTVIQWYLDGSSSTYDGASTIPNVSTRAEIFGKFVSLLLMEKILVILLLQVFKLEVQ